MVIEDFLIRVRAETAEAMASLTSLTSGIGLLGVAAGVAAAGAFVKMGIDAQTQLSRVQGLAGVGQAQMDSYTAALEKMGGAMGVSLTEAAKGLYYVVSAGFSGADALNILHGAMQASEASGADLADVTHGVAGALNAYGAKASEAGKYTDIMTGAVTFGMQTYQEFAHEMGMATATAAAHKVPLVELAAAEASLTEKGLPAAAAFTGLNFAITKVMVPAKEMGDNVRAMGGHFDAAKFGAMSFVDRLNYLHSATGISETDFIKLIGGTRSSKAALDLVGDSGAAYATVLKKLGDSSGMTAAAFAVHDKTIEDSMKDLGASISNAAYEFVKFITPTVVPFLKSVGDAITEVTGNVQKYAPLIGGIAVAATLLLAAAVWSLAAAVIAATWPLLLVIAVIALVAAGLIYAYQHWTGFRIGVDIARDALGRFFSSIGPWLSQFGSWVQSVIRWFQMIPPTVGAVFNLVGSTIHGWVVAVGGFFNALGTTIRSVTSNTWNALVSIILSAVGRAAGAVNTVNNAILGALSGLGGRLAQIVIGAINNMIGAIRGMAGAVGNAVGSLFSGLGSHMPHFAEGGVSAGGLAMVGESGPELVALPRGAQVYRSGTGPGGGEIGGGSGVMVIHVHSHNYLDGRELAGGLGQPLVNEIRLRTGQRV